MSHNTHEGIRNLSPVSSISLPLLFFYFIIVFYFLTTTELLVNTILSKIKNENLIK